jgi:hypothetical protein
LKAKARQEQSSTCLKASQFESESQTRKQDKSRAICLKARTRGHSMIEELALDIIHSLWMNNNSLSYIMKV